MRTLSACIAGHCEREMPYKEVSKEHERLENVLKAEIIKLIREGVSEYHVGGQTGIASLASLLIINVKEELGTTANINMVVPYESMEEGFTDFQRENFEWIRSQASTITYMNEKYAKKCYSDRNRHMIANSNYLIAVCMNDAKKSGTQTSINMAIKKGIEVRIIDPITYEVDVIKAKKPINIFDK